MGHSRLLETNNTPMNYTSLEQGDREAYDIIRAEEQRQRSGLELIASENYVSEKVIEALGSVLTNKYSEGYPGKRYYGGNEVIDRAETLAIDRARELFSAEHVNVQPLSGSPANLAVYMATLQPGDKVLAMALDQGGHLSHGHPLNFSGKLYTMIPYGVRRDTERVDMDEVEAIALREKPKMILAGFSAYSRTLDWKRFKEIADKVGAITFADMAHIAGLVAGKQLENPVPIFDIVSTTTHKTLRGPRGAMIMCKEQYAAAIDKSVFPGVQGGPHDHVTLAKAVAYGEALQPSFQAYAAQVIKNAARLAAALAGHGFRIVSGGTDNHLIMVDMFGSKGVTGKEAERLFDTINISTNKNMIPFDQRKPLDPSGIRLGTPALTTRGMREAEIDTVAGFISRAIEQRSDESAVAKIKGEVIEFSEQFPVPGIAPRAGASNR